MANGDAERAELVAAMLDPGFYPHAPRSVELRDTHISWVFLAADLAYKVKKPVVFPFLDYGTVERRHEMCREEVRLNRRLAPEVYLRVVGIARAGDRYTLCSEDDPEAVEYAVEMRRVEEHRSLAALATRGEVDPAQIRVVGARLARFHSEAAQAPAEFCDLASLDATLDENLTTLRARGSGIVPEARLDAAECFTRRSFAARHDELEARARAGLVRDCHGDLRAEHVIVPARAPVYVFDCVEFNASLRGIDVAADIAFLVMDLARLGAGRLGVPLIEAYREAGGVPGSDALVSFFASYRAWVRAKVACVRVHELESGDPERSRQEAEAREFLRLGHLFAWRARGPLVLVICGVAGTGKTTVARKLAELSGWTHVSSDVTRKRLAGLVPTERGDEGLYSPAFTSRTYRELGRAAAEELAGVGGAIVDATFHRRSARAAFLDGLGARAAPLFVECRASTEVLLSRVRERDLDPERTSDADATIVRRQLAELEPLVEVPANTRLDLLTDADPDRLAVAVECFVDESLQRDAVGPARV